MVELQSRLKSREYAKHYSSNRYNKRVRATVNHDHGARDVLPAGAVLHFPCALPRESNCLLHDPRCRGLQHHVGCGRVYICMANM